jgi:putative acetyltransferase
MSYSPAIREETPDDHAAIRKVNLLAFGGSEEADIVDRLRSGGLVVASLVAVLDGQVVGHILFSELPVDAQHSTIPAVSLAPMAVRPEWQRRGIGSELVRRGLEVCRERGKAAVLVLGHPEYYPRFGFSSELAKNLRSPFSGEAWMAVELTPGVLSGIQGTVRYPDAFGLA